jgi:hypothetical protein
MAEVISEVGKIILGVLFIIAVLLLSWAYYTYSVGYRIHKLKKLQRLVAKGLITQEDYDQAKQEILKGVAEQPDVRRMFGKKQE